VLHVLGELPPGVQVWASLVWVRALAADDEPATQTAMESLQHPRLSHFYDHHQRAAREMASALGGAGHFAWDVYLVFDSQATWRETPPTPVDWAHQLDNSEWAPAERRRSGEALVQAISQMIKNALHEPLHG
jgi:hypothetical protein